MEAWSQWLLTSLIERAKDQRYCSFGELSVISESSLQSPRWWLVQLAESPATSAFLIRMANSAAYAHRKHVFDLESAIKILGHKTARNLIFGEIIRRMFPVRGKDWVSCSTHWRHIIAVASISSVFAKLRKHDPGETFLYGLMHDIGQLLLFQQGGEAYSDFQKNYLAKTGIGKSPSLMTEGEREHLGFDHAMLGAAMAAKWGLSPSMVSALRDHHRIDDIKKEIQPGTHLSRVAIIDLAEQYATALGYGHFGHLEGAVNKSEFAQKVAVMAKSSSNEVLNFSQIKLRWLQNHIESQINQVFKIARGDIIGDLWEENGIIDKTKKWVKERSVQAEYIDKNIEPVSKTPSKNPVSAIFARKIISNEKISPAV